MNNFVERFFKIIEMILAVILGLIVITVTIQVFSRYVLDAPTSWSEELTRYLFIWLSLLGAAVALHKAKHLGVDNLANLLRGKALNGYLLLISIVIIVYLVILAVASVKLTLMVVSQHSPSIGLSMAVPYSALIVGIVVMLIEQIGNLFKIVAGFFSSQGEQG